jgi:hypothetical protein
MPILSTNPFFLFALRSCFFLLPALAFFASSRPGCSQENPYIVAYDHNQEEPGSLEVEYFSTFGTQRGGPDFHANWAELEYGTTAWWTTDQKLPEPERWQLVSYLKSLGTAAAETQTPGKP